MIPCRGRARHTAAEEDDEVHIDEDVVVKVVYYVQSKLLHAKSVVYSHFNDVIYRHDYETFMYWMSNNYDRMICFSLPLSETRELDGSWVVIQCHVQS